jgi:putative addiction module component (TIGR02574 family)
MTDDAIKLKDQLLQLSQEDRFGVAQMLLESLEDHVLQELDEAAWIAELERRSADLEAGRATAQPFREAIEELRMESPLFAERQR